PGQDQRFPLYLGGAGGVANAFGANRLAVSGVLGASAGSVRLSNQNLEASDLDGDGIFDWLHQPAPKSYAVYTPKLVNGQWTMVGRAVPTSAQQDPRLDLGSDADETRVLDVNGDGLVDVVRSTGTQMQTFFALGRYPGGDGQFGNAQWTSATSA